MPGLVSYYAPAGCKWVLRWALPAVVASLPHRDGLYACYGTHPPGHPLYSWPMLPSEAGAEGLPLAGAPLAGGGTVPDIGGVIPAGFAPSGYGPGSAGGYGAGGYGGFVGGPAVIAGLGGGGGGGGVIAGPGIGPVVVANTPPAPTPVPEPSSFALFGFMVAALAWIKRKAR